MVNAVLIKPVPFPTRIAWRCFMSIMPQGSFPSCSPAKFQHYCEQTSVTQDVAAFRTGAINLTGGAFPERLPFSSGQNVIGKTISLSGETLGNLDLRQVWVPFQLDPNPSTCGTN
jgi:hypothetical protein